MIEEKRFLDIKQTSRLNTSKYAVPSFISTLAVLIVGLACIALSYLEAETLLITIPLLLFPTLLSVQCAISSFQGGMQLSHRDNLRYFSLYYRELFGVYRGFLTMAKTFLATMGGCLVIGGVYSSIAQAVNPEFATAVNEWAELITKNDLEAVYQYYQNSSVLQTLTTVMLSGGFFCGLQMVMHCFARNALNVFFRSSNQGAPARMANYTFGNFQKRNRGLINAWYYGLFYPAIILSTVGFGAGLAIGFLVEPLQAFAPQLGLALALLALTPFLPFFFNAIERMSVLLRREYMESSLALAEESLEAMKATNVLDENELKQAEDTLRQAKEEFENGKKDGDETPSSDSDDDNPYGER